MSSSESLSKKSQYPEMSDAFNVAAEKYDRREGAEEGATEGATGERGRVVRRISGAEFFEKTGIDGRALKEEEVPETEGAKVEKPAEFRIPEIEDEEKLEKQRKKLDKFYESMDEIVEDIDGLEPVPFRALDGDKFAREIGNRRRMARKLTVAIITNNPRKLQASDYKLGGEMRYLIRGLDHLSPDQMDLVGDSVLRQIATPVRKKGAEAVYDKIREDEEATLRLYNLTDGWKAKDDENREISLEEQRKIGAEAVNEVLDKYPTALSFRREVQDERQRIMDRVPPDASVDEIHSASIEARDFAESAMKLGAAIYGAQFDYAQIFDEFFVDEVMYNMDDYDDDDWEEVEERDEAEDVEGVGAVASETEETGNVEGDGVATSEGEKVEPAARPRIFERAAVRGFRETGQEEEDARVVQEGLEKLEREKAEVGRIKILRVEKAKSDAEKEEAERKAQEKRKQEVSEAREEARERFGVRLQAVKEPEAVWEKVKANKAVFVSGGELFDIYGEGEGRPAEMKAKRYKAKDFEDFGLIPDTVASYISGKATDTGEEQRRTVVMSRPFRISGGDRGAGVLIWRQEEMSAKGKKKTGKQFKFFPEVYYKRDMDTDKRWLKVEGFAQKDQLGPGAVDYKFMEEEGGEFVKETSEGLSSVLDTYVEDADDYDFVGNRTSGDLILASATKQKATVRADAGSRSGVSRIITVPFVE